MHPQTLNIGLVYGSDCLTECLSDVLFWGCYFKKNGKRLLLLWILCVLDEIIILKTLLSAVESAIINWQFTFLKFWY